MRNRLGLLAIAALACTSVASAQMGRTLDWSTFGGDNQRTGWEKSDSRFKKEEVASGFQLLWKVKPEGKGPRTLMPPVIIGTLIGYRGFKELAFIGASDGALHVMDSDLNRMYWERRFEGPAAKAMPGCPGGRPPADSETAIATGKGVCEIRFASLSRFSRCRKSFASLSGS